MNKLLLNVSELRKVPVPHREWVVKDLLQSGRKRISLLAGKPHDGKSTLALQLAVAVTKGEPFLGRATTRGPVLFWQTEEEQYDIRESLDALGYDEHKDEELLVFFGGPMENNVLALRDVLNEHPELRLVIIETLDDLLKMGDLKENTAARESFDKFYSMIFDKPRRAAILALHHLKKRETESVGDMLLGATVIRGRTDTKLFVRRVSDDDPRRIIHSENRVGLEIPRTYLDFDADTRTSTLGKSVAEDKLEERDLVRERVEFDILSMFTRFPDSPVDVLKGVKGKSATKDELFRSLLKEGRIKITGGEGKKSSPLLYAVATLDEYTDAINSNVLS